MQVHIRIDRIYQSMQQTRSRVGVTNGAIVDILVTTRCQAIERNY